MTRNRCVVTVALAALAMGTVTMGAQDGKADRRNGIYLEKASADAAQLIPHVGEMKAEGVGQAMATFGLKKPHMVTRLRDDRADVRTSATPSFLFVFGVQPSPADVMANPALAQTAMNGMPMNARNPKDFSLLLLAPNDGDRIYDSGKSHQVKLVVETLGPHAFRVHPASALESGEYGFSVLQNGTAGQIWDFGVDAK